ncbi:MAG: signal peptide peptidase SppA [Ignavibacteria bacterium]|nr:signal peptide peptidase SppA [Ignavibacteria bacterium]
MEENTTHNPVPPPPGYSGAPRKKSRWWIPLAVIAGLLIIVIAIFGAFVSFVVGSLGDITAEKELVNVKENSVLTLNLSSGVNEHNVASPFNFMGESNGASLIEIVMAINEAKTNDKIRGIYYTAGGSGVGMAKLTEIREALLDFKTSGKFIYAFIESGSKSHYYIASVADSIFMPEEGMMEFNAFGATGVFMKGLSEKLGVSWHVEQFEEYKSAAESMSRDNWSAPAKQELHELLDQRAALFVNAVSSARKLTPAYVNSALDRGLYTADSLLGAGLIDGFARESEVRLKIARRVNPKDTSENPKVRLVGVQNFQKWIEHTDESIDKNHMIAIVYASGAITSGKNDSPWSNDGIHSASLIKDLKSAAKDDEIEAILLRIDSPGGSAIASDEIWATIKEIRKTKPVFASMSDVAASGGYYIAMACDTIIAHPATITGSIGVIMAIPNFAGTMNKIGVGIDTVSLGRSSGFMNTLRPFSDADKASLRLLGGGIYRRFVQKVADSRGKSFEDTRALAKGRVWTGVAAKENGLVDILGGMQEALKAVKRRIGADENKKVYVKVYPEQEVGIQAILNMFGIGDEGDDDSETSSSTQLSTVLHSIFGTRSDVEQVWKSLPLGAQNQIKHAIKLAEIGTKEHTLVMLPAHLPLN